MIYRFALAVILVACVGSLDALQQPKVESIPAPPDVAAPPADAMKLPSGLAFKILTPGKGETRSDADDIVTVHYTGWTTDGKMFDSSYARKAPSSFFLNMVIKGWGEAVQLMSIGEKRRIWIPQNLAYAGTPNRPQGMLVFDIELLDVSPSPPPDVAAPPPDAKKTASGLAYRVLRPGTGTARPGRASSVTVHYTGWTTDGKMFDSSIRRNQPATFGLNDVIPGWTEGVQLMTEGEKTRFWIPEKLAYDGDRGKPAGMLVFDIELLTVR